MPVVVELSRGSLIGVVVWAYADARGEKSIERTTRKVVSLYTNGTVLKKMRCMNGYAQHPATPSLYEELMICATQKIRGARI